MCKCSTFLLQNEILAKRVQCIQQGLEGVKLHQEQLVSEVLFKKNSACTSTQYKSDVI